MTHPIERAQSRYNLTLITGDLVAIAWLIRNRKPEDSLVRLHNSQHNQFDIYYKSRWLRVRLTPDRKTVTTVVPRPDFTLGQAAPQLGEL